MTPEEAKICDLYVYAAGHLEELGERELTAADIENLLSLTNTVLGISKGGRDRYEHALHHSAQATLDLHTWWDDEAMHNEWTSARDELLRIWNDRNKWRRLSN